MKGVITPFGKALLRIRLLERRYDAFYKDVIPPFEKAFKEHNYSFRKGVITPFYASKA